VTLIRNTFEGGTSGNSVTVATSATPDALYEEPTTTAATIAFSNAQATSRGSLSAKYTFSNVSGNAYCRWNQTGARTTVVRFYIYITTRPSTSAMGLVTLTSATFTNKYANLGMNTSGQIALYDYAGGYSSPNGDTTYSTTALSLNTWYRVEFSLDNSGGTTAGAAVVKVYTGDGTSEISGLSWSTTSKNYGGANFANLVVGRYFGTTANGTPTFYIDDVGWDTGTTTLLGVPASDPPAEGTATVTGVGTVTATATVTGTMAGTAAETAVGSVTATASVTGTLTELYPADTLYPSDSLYPDGGGTIPGYDMFGTATVTGVGTVTATATVTVPSVPPTADYVAGVRLYVDLTGSPTHFPTTAWTEVTSRLLAQGGATYSTGVTGRGGQEWAAGSFTAVLNNTDGTLSGPALLRRPMLMRFGVGGTNIDVRLVVTDVVEFRDGIRRLSVTGTDMLGLAADLEVGATFPEQLTAAATKARWQLTADGTDSVGTIPLAEEPWWNAPAAAGQDYSGQTPVYASIDGCPALSGGGVTLEPVAGTGFAGLYAPVPGTSPWTWAGWCRVPATAEIDTTLADGGVVVSVAMSTGRHFGVGYHAIRNAAYIADLTGSDSSWADGWPRARWLWVVLGTDVSNVIYLTVSDAQGTVLMSAPVAVPAAGETPVGLALGGMMDPARPPAPAHVDIADAVWCASPHDTAVGLVRGHIGYPGETVSARAVRLLTAAGLVPPSGTWNGTAPPSGPPLSDQPWTRRPLAEALNEALDSGGFVIHDLPVGTTTATSLGALAPDRVDGWGVTPTTYSGARVLLASDGVTTNTGMLTNAATVTNQSGAQVSYEDAASVATYGRRAVTVTSVSSSSDSDASLASWKARRAASPTQALGLPDLVLDVDGMVTDGHTATVVAVAKVGACITVTGLMPGGANYSGVVRGLRWERTSQGAMRLTLNCQPLRPLAYALLDDTATATLDNVTLGW
jgi:hypothetical protein